MPFCFKIIFQECLDQNNFSMAGWISFQLLDNFAPEFTIPCSYTSSHVVIRSELVTDNTIILY